MEHVNVNEIWAGAQLYGGKIIEVIGDECDDGTRKIELRKGERKASSIHTIP